MSDCRRIVPLALIAVLAIALCCASGCSASISSGRHGGHEESDLTGAWRSKIRFSSGAFASIEDLEFLYVFNEGGTMTESSNYDGAPPVAPAYGVWRKSGSRQYEARYTFFATKPPGSWDEIENGSGWLPSGSGTFMEIITLSDDRKTFTSRITYEAFGPDGKSAPGGGAAVGTGARMGF